SSNEKWNFPHCLGAIDGKHIVIQSPNKSGTEYFNYKDTFSIVLMALVDANYNFIFVDVGCQGRISDSVYRNTDMWKKFENGQLMLPADEPLDAETNIMFPYVFVVDSAFALNKHMMKLYSGVHDKGNGKRVFNYRLSRARRVVENAFGIIASVFKVFRRPILPNPDKVTNVTMTCALLHNFLRKSKTSSSNYCPQGTFDSEKEGSVSGPGKSVKFAIMLSMRMRRDLDFFQ
ncbi:protein ANTAGONIST OF LIKE HETEROCHROMATIN PROTEIN 1-like, partial [Aphis craccivora]